jgi:hypothetical protein
MSAIAVRRDAKGRVSGIEIRSQWLRNVVLRGMQDARPGAHLACEAIG